MEIVTTIGGKFVESIVDYTVAPIARQVGYLIFYKNNFKNLKDQVAELKRVKDTINHEVEVERRNGRQIYDAVQNWLERVDEIIQVAEQLVDDCRHRNVGCCKGPFPNLKLRHQLSRKSKKTASNIAKVMQGKDNIGPLTFLPYLEGVVSTSTTSSEKLESRKKIKEDIVLALRDDNLTRIGVYGLGGVGKTTLVKEIAKQVKDDKLFGEVVMANTSQGANLERIQGEIADQLGLHFEETTIVGRAHRLRQRIKNEKSILVILDDIWEILELDQLGIPLDDHKGCKLLLTSRNLNILQKMKTQNDVFIDVLNEEEAWRLFEDMVGDVVKDVSLRDVAIQVAQKCAGLIVLIVTVARALKKEDNIDSWKDALNQLKTVDKEGMNEKIYSALEFSYNHLEGHDLKALFLLCGLLGPQIQVEYLVKYVMGLGIFKQVDSPKVARLKLHRLIGSLKASCLLLESNSNDKVKMHDIVHEVAVSIASRDQHVYKIGMDDEPKGWPSEEFLQRCTQIFIHFCHIPKLPERLACPNIKLFCLCNKNESLSVPDSFFEGMKNLKLLELSYMHLPSLPQSFHSLVDLHTLCLHDSVLGDMTNIEALTNLQILSLHGSSMIMLPSQIGQLTHIAMLYLTESGIEIFPPNIISKLTKLEELHLGNTSIKWDQEYPIEENKYASLSELRHLINLSALEIQIKGAWVLPRDIMFDKLERYKIVIGDVWEWSVNHKASKMLKLKLGTVIHLEHGIKELIKGVEDLYLDEVNGISNVLFDLDGEGFPLLKHINIQNNGNIQHIINSMERKLSHVFFPKLETLILQNLNRLEKICHGSFADNSFAKLRCIKVKCCDQLMYLFSVLMVKALCQLAEIEVSECSSMKKIVSVENCFPNSMTVYDNIEFCSLQSLTLRYLPAIEDFYFGWFSSPTTTIQSLPTSFFNTKIKFSNLETLKLSSIHLENIWQDDHLSIANSFHKLAKLTVEECSGLKYLFSSSMLGCFPYLKELEIRECDMMEEIIGPEVRNGTAIEKAGLPKLDSVVLSNMKRLKKVCHSQFDGLKTMEVNNCEKLENIFPSDMHTTFGRMETLKVNDCHSVKEIFQLPSNEINSEEDTQLKKLHLLHLPKLKQIWSKDPQENFRFQNLQDVHVEDCENLEYLFPFSIALDLHQLEKLTVEFCGMIEIVAKKEGSMEEKAIFNFDRLYYLDIWNMHKLDRFYGGSHSLTCPSLRTLFIFNCAKLKLLGRQSISDHKKNADNRNQCLSMQQPILMIEEIVPKLEDWTLNNKDAIMMLQDPQWKDHLLSKLKTLRMSMFEDKMAATFLDSIVKKAPNLKNLIVQGGSLKEIFQDKRVAYKEGKNEIKTQLEMLFLFSSQLKHICREGYQVDPILEVLEYLRVRECAHLKTLVPSSVTFSHLIYLKIKKCNGLINLIHSSTATSLVNLKDITIKECNSLEEIVTRGKNETRDEIVFRSLRTLTLKSLPRLNSFSSSHYFFRFPWLEKVVVMQCPTMKTFFERATSSPMLRKVIIKEGKHEEWCWEGDLNRTINKIYVDKIAFCNMEHLDLSLYHEPRDFWYSAIENKIFCNLKSLVVQHCDFVLDVLLPSNLIRALGNLEEIQVRDCDLLEAVIEFDTAKEEAILEKGASHLRKIRLINLPRLQYIKKPSLGGKTEEDEVQIQHQQPLSFSTKVLLPKLETIIIEDMENLETIWHPVLTPHSMGSFETLKVKNCQKIQHIFPIYMHGAFATLETLEVEDCNSVEEIFQLVVIEKCSGEDTTQLKNITLLRLPKLKQIWSRDPQSSLSFRSLQVVRVENCGDLAYLFPFSIAIDLPLLEQITIKRAKRMKEIVSKREEPSDNPVKFEFKSLTSLVLWNLIDLEGFYSGNHSLACHILETFDFFRCMKLKLFNTPCVSSQGRLPDGNLQVSMQQPLFTLEEVMVNLEQLALSNEHVSILLQGHFSGEHFKKLKILTLQEFEDDQTTFPYWFLQNMTGLEYLIVEWNSFKEIFAEEVPHNMGGKVENETRIKKLRLINLHELHRICKQGCQIDPVLEVLEHIEVVQCSNLKYLVPSSVTFDYLTYLEVQNCNGLIYLISSSTARSLVKLTTLKIRECNSIKEIVEEKGGDNINEITFNSLEVLELDNLSKLQMFCSCNCLLKLPLLEKLVIRQCPRMTSFSAGETSTPLLQKILTDEEDGILCWECGLTRAVTKMFQDKVAFSSFNHLEFAEYPELKELWYGDVGQKIICNLKHLVVRKCTFLSNMMFSSNLLQLLFTLEEMEVAECDSLEMVFDLKALDGKPMESKGISRLKKLTLSGLPNLEYIWNTKAGEIISFENLQIMKVDKCQHLKNLFSVSLCQDLRQLKELHVESCGVQEIVSIEEGLLEELKFDFPRLTRLELFNLGQLTNFCPKRFTLDCPSLKTLNVRGCEELQLFAFEDFNSQPLREGDIELQNEQALFLIEKVSGNLEDLSLNEKDTMRILNGNYEKNHFQRIEILRLRQFQEPPTKFLHDLILKFPATTTLQACSCSFETLFPSKEIGCSIAIPTQIKKLWIFQSEQLHHIWNDDDSASHPLVQNLEELFVEECSRIIRLSPPCASFKNLTSLEVKDCNGLMYFMTPFTAKSLVHLTNLKVCNCEMLEEIVMTDEGESEEDITFESLKCLELTCLSSFKNFCSRKRTFVFPSLVTMKVIGCHNLQNFSSGVIMAPFLKLVEVENEKKRWKEDLNTTIKQLFKEKANGEGVEGDCKESSGINIENNQMHENSLSTSRALNSDESKADETVSSGKQEIQELPTPHTALGTQDDENIQRHLVQTTHQGTLSPSIEFLDTECTPDGSQGLQLHQAATAIKNNDEYNTGGTEMREPNQKLLVQNPESMLIPASVQDIATGTQVIHESIDKPFIQSTQNEWDITIVQNREESHDSDIHVSKNLFNQIITSMAANCKETVGTQVTYESNMRFLAPDGQNVLSPTMVYHTETNEATQTTQEAHGSATIQYIALGTQDEIIERPLVQTTHQGALSPSIVQDTEKLNSDIRNQEIYKTLIPVAQNVLNSPMVDNTAIDLSFSQALEAVTLSIHDEDGSQDLQVHPTENLLFQDTTSTMNCGEESDNGTKEMHETIQRPLVQNAGEMLVPTTSVEDIASGTHVPHENIDERFIQTTQDAWDIIIVHEKEELHDLGIHLSKNLFNQTTASMAADYKENIETQETYESKRISVHDAQNVLSHTMVDYTDDPEVILGNNLSCQTTNSVMGKNSAAIDLSSSQASKAACSSTTPIADVCSSFKDLDISAYLLPYLEAGVKQHPQVLNWLNTEQRRVFASSIFSLFAEVTRILRTTRRGHLVEDDQNYITKCCTVLEVVGFDVSWLSYVYKCIDECGDNAKDIKRKVEETRGQASSLEAQLESIKKELAVLLDKASRLEDFIES